MALIILGMGAWDGCATARPRSRTCGVILLMDGRHLLPTKKQFAAVQRNMGQQFEQHALRLIPDTSEADLIATIECRTALDDAARSYLIVRDIGANTFTGKPAKLSHPTLEQVEREQYEALRGLFRPGID